MEPPSHASEEDLVLAFCVEESEWEWIEGMAIPEKYIQYIPAMKEPKKSAPQKKGKSRKRSKSSTKAEPAPPQPPAPRVRKEKQDLQQLLEWKRSLQRDVSLPSPKAVKRARPQITLEQHLKEVNDQVQREEERQARRRQQLAQELLQQYRRAPAQFPFESPAPQVWVSREDQKRMETQVRFQQRHETEALVRRVLAAALFEETEKPQLSKIPDSFDDGAAYIESFREPFFEEVRGNLINSLGQTKAEKAVTCLLKGVRSDQGLVFLASEPKQSLAWAFKNGDIVLCTDGCHIQGANKLARPSSHYFLGICEKVESTHPEKSELLLKCANSEFLESMWKGPQRFSLLFLDSLLTMEREYRMLHLAEFLELKGQLLSPAPVPSAPARGGVPAFFGLNTSQVHAVQAALDPLPGFTLIQGPPGTGKTHTLVSILSLLLATRQCGVLVCAPSNAAVDEVVSRAVSPGVLGSDGRPRTDCKFVRIGSQKRKCEDLHRQDPKAAAVTLDRLVQEKLKEQGLTEGLAAVSALRTQLSKAESLLEKAEPSGAERLRQEVHRLKAALAQEKQVNSALMARRRAVEIDLLARAEVVFATLSSAGSKQLERVNRRFEYVIIDEGCQAVELSALIPLQYRAQKVVLIGDPMQLPATTFSEEASRCGYSRSLFERLLANGLPVYMLQEQYRMVKEIREFPSDCFYDGRLVDGVSGRKCPNWLPGPEVLFVDLKTSREVKDEDCTSISNPAEVAFICDLYEHFRLYHGFGLDIGIITPYRKQVLRLRHALKSRFGKTARRDIEVNTVDGFQGREKDIIVFSSVRSGDQIGFLADTRRLNVAITRAKFALWMVGRKETLHRHRTWAHLLEYIRQKHTFTCANCFDEVKSVFQKRSVASLTEPLRRVVPAASEVPAKREPTNYSKLFDSMVPRSETRGGIVELIEARERKPRT